MTDFPFEPEGYDSTGGTFIYSFIQEYFDTTMFDELAHSDRMSSSEKKIKIGTILDYNNLDSYKNNLLSTSRECIKNFKSEILELPYPGMEPGFISRFITLIDTVIDGFLSINLNRFRSLSTGLPENFSSFSFKDEDLNYTNRTASILENILLIQISILRILKSELLNLFQLYSNRPYIQPSQQAEKKSLSTPSQRIKYLKWKGDEQSMYSFFENLWSKGLLGSSVGNNFETIYAIISSKIQNTSIKKFNSELIPYRDYKIIWSGKRVTFVQIFYKLYTDKTIFIDINHHRDTIVRALHGVFWFETKRPKKGDSNEIGVTALINDFKHFKNDPEEFNQRGY